MAFRAAFEQTKPKTNDSSDVSSDSSDDTLVDSASANKGIKWSAEISNFIASFLMASMIF